jgi:S-adenosylmethionine synthetase
MAKRVFTSESVTEGHPDKLCDQVADAILDKFMEQDPNARVACECVATTGMVLVMGEISADCYVDIPATVRKTVEEIGYVKPEYGFDYRTCAVLTTLDEQSPDIAQGVDQSLEFKEDGTDPADLIGGGDQGMRPISSPGDSPKSEKTASCLGSDLTEKRRFPLNMMKRAAYPDAKRSCCPPNMTIRFSCLN